MVPPGRGGVCFSCLKVFKISKNYLKYLDDDRIQKNKEKRPRGRTIRRFLPLLVSRQEGRCHWCWDFLPKRGDGGYDYSRIHVDHIRPRSKGGTNDLENLQALCKWCNSEKGALWFRCGTG